jgi:glycosyltransferase involved in cell wall biosynthesis
MHTWPVSSTGAAAPTVTVVICAYASRRADALLAAAAAVLEQLAVDDELVVVVDHNQELLEHARSAIGEAVSEVAARTSGRVRVIANENRRGLSGARNAGTSSARGEIVAFLDDDALPRARWLAALREPFSDPAVIGAGGIAAPAWESERPAWMPEEFLWVVGCSYRGLPEHAVAIRNPIGANMAFRRSVLEAAGGFTDGLGRVGRTPLGCEETEFSIRAVRACGGQILQQPDAVVDHAVSSDRLTAAYFARRCWAEGISKAIVSRLTGADTALASERRYVTRTLPSGITRAAIDGLTGDSTGFGRAGAIVAGLTVTVAGYIRGSLSRGATEGRGGTGPPGPQAAADFAPMWSGQLELELPELPAYLADGDGRAFERARLLIRASGTPVGFLTIETPGGRTDLAATVELARTAFADAARRVAAEREPDPVAGRSVSVVLCTHDRADGARKTLESLRQIEHNALEIIVVDNAPSDDSTSLLVQRLSQGDPRIRYVREEQKGLSRARNRGLREATGEVTAFTDDDVRVDPLWVSGLLKGFARRPDVACVTGLVASSSLATPAEQYFDQRVWWSSSCEQRLYSRERREGDSPLHPYAAGIFGTGANFAAKTAELRSVGGFDQALGAGSPTRGGEDLDIFVRLITAGHALSYEPSALVWHEHRVDEASLREQMYAYGLGLTAYLTKYALSPGSRRAVATRALVGVRHLFKLVRRSNQAGTSASVGAAGMTAIEVRGMLLGPLAYLRARRTQDPRHLQDVAP